MPLASVCLPGIHAGVSAGADRDYAAISMVMYVKGAGRLIPLIASGLFSGACCRCRCRRYTAALILQSPHANAMPQADLFFTADQAIAAVDVLRSIEGAISAMDAAAGACKGRAYPVADFHHSHILLRLSMLPKDHRDAAFAAELGKRLAAVLQQAVTADCAINVQVRFDLVHYTAVPPRQR